MNDEPDNTDKTDTSETAGAAKKTRQAGRRPATIDLKATEVGAARDETTAASRPADKETGAPDAPEASDAPVSGKDDGDSAPAGGGGDGGNGDHNGGPGTGRDDGPGSPPPPDGRGDGPAQRHTGPGIVMLLAAAVAGAVLALGGLLALERGGMVVRQTSSDDSRSRLDALARDVGALRGEVERSEEGDLTARIAQLEQRVREQAERAAVPAQAGDSGDASRTLEPLEQRIAGAEAQLTLLRSEQDNLLRRIDEGASPEDVRRDLSSLAERMDALEEAVRARGESAQSRAASLEDLQQRVSALSAAVDEAADSQPRSDRRAALAIAVAGLERAVASGEPFAQELGVVGDLAGGRTEIDVLQPLAADGIARMDELSRSFEEASRRALDASSGSTGDGIVNRLLSNARDLVRVRPTDAVEGSDAGAVLARAQAQLRGGDLLAATQELNALDPDARAAMADWLERARQRLTALRQVAALNESIMSDLRAEPDGGRR